MRDCFLVLCTVQSFLLECILRMYVNLRPFAFQINARRKSSTETGNYNNAEAYKLLLIPLTEFYMANFSGITQVNIPPNFACEGLTTRTMLKWTTAKQNKYKF